VGTVMWWRSVVGLGLVAAGAIAAEAAAPRPELVTLRGRAVELSLALKDLGVKADQDPVARQVVIRGEDGQVTPLLSDDSSRALFLDERLRDRPLEAKVWRYPGLPYVQVVSFQVEEAGKLRTPEYYCDVCTIRVRFPQVCPCCQGPMELRMRPES